MRAKKHLGQHFLTSTSVVSKIVETSDLKSNDVVLEIGPGKGVLTEALLEKSEKVVAVEKDSEMVGFLQKKFEKEIKNGKLILIQEDIRGFSPSDYQLPTNNYKLVANIPYYITGEILKSFLSGQNKPSCMVLLVQDEVAERIVASDGRESILSISVKVYGAPKKIIKVSRDDFDPKPKVDSAVLLIDKINDSFFSDISERSFFNLVRLGFSHKRKKLLSNLKSDFPKEKIEEVFKKLNVSLNTRAEELSPQEWKALFLSLSEQETQSTDLN